MLLFVSKFSKSKILEPFRNSTFRKTLAGSVMILTVVLTGMCVKFLPVLMKLGLIILNFVAGYFIVTTFMKDNKEEKESK